MSMAGEQTITAAQPGIAETCFLNPFTNKLEPFRSESDANQRMLRAAAESIRELQKEVAVIKAHLVLE